MFISYHGSWLCKTIITYQPGECLLKVCDKTNTKVVIYPQKPYNKTSYKIETQLDCGFDATNTK